MGPVLGPPPAPQPAAPTGHAGQGDSVGPPHPHTRAHSTRAADPGSPPEEGSGRRESAWPHSPPTTGPPMLHGQQGEHLVPTRTRERRLAEPAFELPYRRPNRANDTCTSHGKSAPHPLLLDTVTQQWRNPRPHAKHAPGLRRWTQHTRSSALELRGGEGDLPQEDAGADSDLEIVRRTYAAGGQRARPLPPVETGPLHRRRLPQVKPPPRSR